MEVQRTLVKSPPELWAELSDVEALTRHLAAFGEITITRVEPETTVAWEGERASGTVELAASGWGTKVTLTAEPAAAPAPPEPEPEPEAEPPPRRRWLRFWQRDELEPEPPPAPAAAPATPEPAADPEAVLSKVLDDLGQAHHRPFQR
ncbi:MAG TPA: hypothetical protein VNZ62_05630 [Capillimicrobium sp.]|nr:hypothetical protein [Capillimicrobium sp.]